jgi:NADPH:quinone reductase-like Zn-dependent oxidoreductase
VAPMPEGMSFAEAAAATDGALNALWCLRLAGPLQGRRVLVYGASGAIGTAAVQVAKHFGAEVTAVCGPKGVEVVKAIGADRVIDYTKEDFASDRDRYFSVFDAVGKESFAHCRGLIEPGGTYLATDGFRNLLLGFWTSRFGDRKVMFKLPPRYTQEDVVLIKELMEAGSYRPVIDRTYPIEEVVEAARYVETQQKIGNVVLAVGDGGCLPSRGRQSPSDNLHRRSWSLSTASGVGRDRPECARGVNEHSLAPDEGAGGDLHAIAEGDQPVVLVGIADATGAI